MKKITNLKDKLLPARPIRFLTIDGNSELGYFRCDNDRAGKWWAKVWQVHNELYTKELGDEFDAVLNAFFRSFKNLSAMTKWCYENAERTDSYDEFNAYYDGDNGFYWLRMITRRGDYNLYMHCYSKSAM